ncbi:MAG: tautomerase family protein [Proteobacteria bacterium]|nr:tautomerase family protein [Pseudomonadota bacterium]MDA1331797.1 tautomerase family protein [Pseudomonadota bacterium]
MPIIRVVVPERTSLEIKHKIRTDIKDAVLRTLAPKETKYDYVSISEALGVVGDGLPVVDVDLRPGRSPERKKALVDEISRILFKELNIKEEDIYVLFRENPAENHYTGGTPLPEWKPASELT